MTGAEPGAALRAAAAPAVHPRVTGTCLLNNCCQAHRLLAYGALCASAGDRDVVIDTHAFLLGLMSRFPHLRRNDLFYSGEEQHTICASQGPQPLPLAQYPERPWALGARHDPQTCAARHSTYQHSATVSH